MAVQAHFPHDSSTRIQNLDELESQQLHGFMNPLLLNNYKINGFMNPLLLNNYKIKGCISNPQSEMTVNGRGLKKRGREESSSMDLTNTPIHFGGFVPNMIGSVVNPSISTDQMRVIGSTGTSTSGRVSCSASTSSADLLLSHLYNQSLEMDTLIRLQNERLRAGLEQAQKRHCRSLISLFEQQIVKKLREKDAELTNALRRNDELEEKVQQMSAENQAWYNFAMNNEAIVANLKASLEQALLQNAAVDNNAVQAKEGYGDSDSDGAAFPADEAQSCCFVEEGEEKRTNGAVRNVTAEEGRRAIPDPISCKVCHEKEVAVLLLPCRHLCLCVDCESKANTCPVCHVGKKGSLQIFLS